MNINIEPDAILVLVIAFASLVVIPLCSVLGRDAEVVDHIPAKEA